MTKTTLQDTTAWVVFGVQVFYDTDMNSSTRRKSELPAPTASPLCHSDIQALMKLSPWWMDTTDFFFPQQKSSRSDSSRGKKKLIKVLLFPIAFPHWDKNSPIQQKPTVHHYDFPHLQYTFIKGFQLLCTIFSGWLMPTLRLPIFTTDNTPACAQLSSD